MEDRGLLVGMAERGVRPDLILFADTGGEKPETYEFVNTMDAWKDGAVSHVKPLAIDLFCGKGGGNGRSASLKSKERQRWTAQFSIVGIHYNTIWKIAHGLKWKLTV